MDKEKIVRAKLSLGTLLMAKSLVTEAMASVKDAELNEALEAARLADKELTRALKKAGIGGHIYIPPQQGRN
ncbi:MAG: hypothetical protein AAGA18_14820 [Verrucomicrobiota bacterium]